MSDTKPMTKTAARKGVADLRREARRITDILTPTPDWIREQTGQRPFTEAQIRAVIEDALNNIDGISAQLREGLVGEDH